MGKLSPRVSVEEGLVEEELRPQGFHHLKILFLSLAFIIALIIFFS